jgi:S-adenosylmethionine hydrolase
VAAIVTLTTDFGTRDAYVAAMKGAILGIARTVQLVDVTHEVAPHDVAEGAFALEAVAPYFPPGTVHVGVVDPGVGTARRGLAVVAAGQVFVGPDNGLFTPFLGGSDWAAFELVAPEYRLRAVSPTFHGRDIFAPAAGHVAAGVDPSRLGPRVPDPVRLAWPASRRTAKGVAGVVVHVDRFGNLITSIPATALAGLGAGAVVAIAGRRLPLVSAYGELTRGGAGALVGGSGRIEIAVREGSAARLFRAGRGTRVVLSRRTTPTSSTTRTTSSRAATSARARRRP